MISSSYDGIEGAGLVHSKGGEGNLDSGGFFFFFFSLGSFSLCWVGIFVVKKFER